MGGDVGDGEATCGGQVSRAGFTLDHQEIIEKSLKILVALHRLSRATFEAQTRRILGAIALERGGRWQRGRRCHEPPSPPNTS